MHSALKMFKSLNQGIYMRLFLMKESKFIQTEVDLELYRLLRYISRKEKKASRKYSEKLWRSMSRNIKRK